MWRQRWTVAAGATGGDIGCEDWQANEHALKHGERLLSMYRTDDGTKFWIITEWDCSLTTVLLPEDH